MLPAEPLHMFDPSRTMHVQGFTGPAATTTIYDATATGVCISGIFQAGEDFAVLGWWNAYDCFKHLRVKPTRLALTLRPETRVRHRVRPRARRRDAPRYREVPVSWDAMALVCGVGGPNDLYEVRLLDHATVVSGGEASAFCQFDAGGIAPYNGIDYLHLYFRDTRYTVAHTDCIVETTLSADVTARTSAQYILIASTTGIGVVKISLK